MQPPTKKIKTAAVAAAGQESVPPEDDTVVTSDETKPTGENAAAEVTMSSAGTTPEMNHAAYDKVLGTTELLENILLGLDTKTLILSQRVSKTFQATIKESTVIQQALFLKPSTTMAPVWNHFAFPKGRDTFFRGSSCVHFCNDNAEEPKDSGDEHSKEISGRSTEYRLFFSVVSKSSNERTPELWPMLLRQPAAALKLNMECNVCQASFQWTLEAGGTFGDLVHYLENKIVCGCVAWTFVHEELEVPDYGEVWGSEDENEDSAGYW